jgi:hypothetical protein
MNRTSNTKPLHRPASHAKKGSESIRGQISVPHPMDDLKLDAGQGTIAGLVNPAAPGIVSEQDEVDPGQPKPDIETVVSPDTGHEPPHVPNASISSIRNVSEANPAAARVSSKPDRRKVYSSTQRYSMVSDDTGQTSRSGKEKPHRKSSTLRGALSKFLGRRKKNTSQDSTTEPESTNERSKTLSAGPSRSARLFKHRESAEVSRTEPPLAQNEAALRSKSIIPESIHRDESTYGSMKAKYTLSRKPSQGTDALIAVGTRIEEFSGLSPRPASTHGRDDRVTREAEDSGLMDEVSPPNVAGLKRRSRSLSGLLGLKNEEQQPRQLSEEIQHWRDSYGARRASHVSSTAAGGEENYILATPDVSVGAGDPPRSPLQPFNFGDLSAMHEMSGMKITQAASMDVRLGNLEKRTQLLAKAMIHLSEGNQNLRSALQGPHRSPTTPEWHPSGYQGGDWSITASSRPSTQQSYGSKPSLDEGAGLAVSSQPANTQPTSAAHRPISTATIRGVTSLPSLSREPPPGVLTIDHYTTLMALIETERSARVVLEAQVKRLTHQVQVMARTSSHSSPGPESVGTQGQLFNETSAFDYDDDDEDPAQSLNRTSADSERLGPAQVRMTSPEAAGRLRETTQEQEERTRGEKEEAEDVEPEREDNNARTMSLSEMTFRRAMPKQSPEQPPPLVPL